MKTKIFHGTSAKNGRLILEQGFQDTERNWTCSVPNQIYFWELNAVADCNGLDAEETIQRCKELAFESATIAASLQSSLSSYIYIFEIDIDEDELSPDLSCECMDEAVWIDARQLNKLIAEGKVEMIVHKYKYSPAFKYFYLSSLINNEFLANYLLSEEDCEICKALSQSNFYIYEILYDLKEIKEEE